MSKSNKIDEFIQTKYIPFIANHILDELGDEFKNFTRNDWIEFLQAFEKQISEQRQKM